MDYLSPARRGSSEVVEKRSRFIGNAAPASTVEEAERFIEEIKSRFPDATHNVYAYSVGLGTPVERLSDDKEPRGTAGYPILDVISKRSLRNVVCVVTRYFGGTLLGSGGLLRAYGKTAGLALDDAGVSHWIYHELIEVGVSYDQFGRVKREIEGSGYEIAGIDYGQGVTVSCYVPLECAEPFSRRLVDITNGKATVSIGQGKHIPRPIAKLSGCPPEV